MPNGNLQAILDLLEEKGTLTEVSRFLERRGLTHSASSWDQMRDDRLLPAIRNGDLAETDLLRLLGELEEHGHQYVFLYETPGAQATAFLDTARLRSALQDLDAADVLESPRFLEKPSEPTIADVRFEDGPFGNALVVKVVETRLYTERLGRQEHGDNTYAIRYRDIPTRAVNLFRLHENGLLEVRLEQHKTASTNYDEELKRMWALLDTIFPDDAFTPLSLSHAKFNLWTRRDELRDIVRYSNSRFQDAEGNSVRAAAGGMNHNLADDPAIVRSLDEFNKADTHCDTAVIWWIEQDSGPPSKDLRTRLAGRMNELAITAGCNEEDYEYVLEQLIRFNSER